MEFLKEKLKTIVRADLIKPYEPRTDVYPKIFRRRNLMRYIRKYHSANVGGMPDQDLRIWVENAIVRARYYGIEDFIHVTMFVAIMLETSPNFDQHPRIYRIFRHSGQSNKNKIEIILDEISDQTWKSVVDSYDVEAWYSLPSDNEQPN